MGNSAYRIALNLKTAFVRTAIFIRLNSPNPQTRGIFPFASVFLSFLFQCLKAFTLEVFCFLGSIYSQAFYFCGYCELLSACCLLLVYGKISDSGFSTLKVLQQSLQDLLVWIHIIFKRGYFLFSYLYSFYFLLLLIALAKTSSTTLTRSGWSDDTLVLFLPQQEYLNFSPFIIMLSIGLSYIVLLKNYVFPKRFYMYVCLSVCAPYACRYP